MQNITFCCNLEKSGFRGIGLMDAYEHMLSVADSVLRDNHKNASQVLVTKTENGKISAFVNDLSETEEINFLSAQRETLVSLLCVWPNGQIDLPSIRIRKGLVNINPNNADAIVYLQGKEIGIKRLSQTIK
jgi:hypothetical protein